jgi:hypothetical protein
MVAIFTGMQSAADATKQCQWCARLLADEPKLQCSGCRSAHYCDTRCQRKDWVAHKPRCGNRAALHSNKQLPLANFVEVSYLLKQLYKQMDAASGKGRRGSSQQSRDAIVQALGGAEPLDLLWSRHIEVRRSEYVHGRGLFATRALPPHAALTFYPAHLLVDAKGSIYSTDKATAVRMRQAGKQGAELAALLADHSCALGPDGLRLVGMPERCEDQRLLGHMVNDAALVDVFASTDVDALRDRATLRRLVVCFLKNALKYTNCAFMSDARHLTRCLVTRREIAAGEELLVTYGLGYWLQRNYGADVTQQHKFIGANLRALCEHDAEFRQLLLRATLELDAPVILSSMALHADC